jgi:hypothetical protein
VKIVDGQIKKHKIILVYLLAIAVKDSLLGNVFGNIFGNTVLG